MTQGPPEGPHSSAASRAADPRTSPAELHELAGSRPDLRPLIAEHPQAYPELLEWLGQLNDPAVNAALARRYGEAPTASGDHTQVLPPISARSAGTPEQPTETFEAFQRPPAAAASAEDTSDFDTQVYGAAGHSQHGAQPLPAHYDYDPYQPTPAYQAVPAAPVHQTAPADYERQPERRRGGGGCVLILLLALVTAGALAASYILLFGNPLAGDDEPDTVVEQEEPEEEEAPAEEQPAAPEDEAAPEEDSEEPDDELARPAPDGSADLTGFSAPSGNIRCELGQESVLCSINEISFEPPAGCEDGLTVRITAEGAAETACEESVAQQGQALDYGNSTSTDDFACVSSETDIECWSQRTGNGFTLAREGASLYDY